MSSNWRSSIHPSIHPFIGNRSARRPLTPLKCVHKTISTIGLVIRMTIRSNYGLMLYNFRDKARYCRKSQFFYTLPAFDTLLTRYSLYYCHSVWCGKARTAGLLDGERLYSLVAIKYANVTDGRTDCRHPQNSKVALYVASRGKNEA